MRELDKLDYVLIERAKKVIRENYREDWQTVGAAVRGKSGAVYSGVNVYSIHGACAEVVALGTALSSGEKGFDCIVAVGGRGSDKIFNPCGNCRQFMHDHCPDIEVIVMTDMGVKKATVAELLPFPWESDD